MFVLFISYKYDWSSWLDAWLTALTQKLCSNHVLPVFPLTCMNTYRPLFLFDYLRQKQRNTPYSVFSLLFLFVYMGIKLFSMLFSTFIPLGFLYFIGHNWVICPIIKEESVSSEPTVASHYGKCLGSSHILGLHLSHTASETGAEPSALHSKASGKLWCIFQLGLLLSRET